MKLTDKDLVLLSAAAARDDRWLTRDAAMSEKAALALQSKLVRGGLVEVAPVGRNQPVWRLDADDRPLGLRITAAGLAAIGVDDDAASAQEEPAAMSSEASSANEAVSRPITKKAMVLAMLAREAGATIDELVAATGWQPHTTRAALTGLRKEGHAIGKGRNADDRSSHRIIPRMIDDPVRGAASAGGKAA